MNPQLSLASSFQLVAMSSVGTPVAAGASAEEPAALMLLGVGLISIAGIARTRRARRSHRRD